MSQKIFKNAEAPVFEITIGEDDETGIRRVSLVEEPAIEIQGMFFNYAEVGERGGIKESRKAPKSDTPNPNPKGEGTAKGDAKSTRGAEVTERVEKILSNKVDDFNERYKDKLGYGANVGMLKSVYQRGIGAFNVSHSPVVKSGEQWALARVNAFLYLLKNGRPQNSKYVNDNDLLPKEHPKRQEMSEIYEEMSVDKEDLDFIFEVINYEFKNIEDKQMVVGPALIPNKKILRKDEDGDPYYVFFTEDTIRTMVSKFNKYNNNKSINVDHSSQMIDGYIQQNWIVEDSYYDKSKLYGYSLPKGSWFIELKIENREQWMEYVKEGGRYSFSVEGLMGQKATDYRLSQFIDNLNEDEINEIVETIFNFESITDYPKGIKETAQRVLNYVEKNGWGSCGTAVGKQRASQLAKGEPISLDTVKRMYSFLSRHKGQGADKGEYGDGCGKLMYDAWGGDAALSWAERKLQQFASDDISFDYDDTLTTEKGRKMAENLIKAGKRLYIISARSDKAGMLDMAKNLGIPESRVFATGSNEKKIEKVNELKIAKHYDNNEAVIKKLQNKGFLV